MYIETIKDKAGSATFDTANNFASSIGDIDNYLADLITDKDAFDLVIAVLQASSWGAFGSQGLEKTKFAKTPCINAKAIKYINENKRKSMKYFNEKINKEMKSDEFIAHYFDAEN